MIGQLSAIPKDVRDKLLIKFISQCKLLHALCFFQWRYQKLKDVNPETAEHNKQIFYQRIDALIRHMEWCYSMKKSIMETAK